MLMVDSSAWIEFLRRSGTAVSERVALAIRQQEAATTDVIMLEVLSGTADGVRLDRWRRLLDQCEYVEQRPREDVESAADVYRACRRAGETPRAPNDCLVAAVALRRGIAVLHRDRDFETIARHTPLALVAP